MGFRFALDGAAYGKIRAVVSEVFDVESRLPVMVFRTPVSRSLFCEYETIFSADFWPAIASVANYHRDRQVEFLVLEPSAESYYAPGYGMYPAFSIPIQSSEDEYWSALNESPGGDVTGALIHSANVVAVAGSSGKWGFWGERDLGIVVVQGVPSEGSSGGWRKEYGPFLEVDEALYHYVAPNYGGHSVPTGLANALANNYSDGESGRS